MATRRYSRSGGGIPETYAPPNFDVAKRDKCFHECSSNSLGSIPGAAGRMLKLVDYLAFRNAVVLDVTSKEVSKPLSKAGCRNGICLNSRNSFCLTHRRSFLFRFLLKKSTHSQRQPGHTGTTSFTSGKYSLLTPLPSAHSDMLWKRKSILRTHCPSA